MSKVSLIFSFSLGAAAGSLISWRVLKTKYERMIQEEIDAYKEHVKNRDSKVSTSTEETKEEKKEEGTDDKEDPDEFPDELYNLLDHYGMEDANNMKPKAHVIEPEEFEDDNGFKKRSLVYYADGVLVDERDNVIKDTDGILVPDFDSHFGEYAEDAVFTRNTVRKIDYEILRDLQTYSESMGMDDYPEYSDSEE